MDVWLLAFQLPYSLPVFNAQVRHLLRLAGRDVRRLRISHWQLPIVDVFGGLRKLSLDISPRAAGPLTIASLAALPELRQLILHGKLGILVEGIKELKQLRSLELADVVPSGGLPSSSSLIELRVGAVTESKSELKTALKKFGGRLQTAHLHMALYDNRPSQLRCTKSLRAVHELHLAFGGKGRFSCHWCPGFFQCLQVLHISLAQVCKNFQPAWDFGTCSLAEFHLCISVASNTCMQDIVNVRADVVHLQLMQIFSGQERCSLDCSSWTIAQAEVHFEKHASFAAHFPLYVSDAVGALMCTQGGPTVLRINGMTPLRAAASAANDGQLDAALQESLAFDPLEEYGSDWESDKLNSEGERLSELSHDDEI